MLKKLLLLIPLGFVGCATTSTTTTQPAPAYKQVEIITEPAGARIEVNDDYVGDAPITVPVRVASDGTSAYGLATTIRALPTRGGDYTQTKVFSALRLDTVPSRIFFDMGLHPVSSTAPAFAPYGP